MKTQTDHSRVLPTEINEPDNAPLRYAVRTTATHPPRLITYPRPPAAETSKILSPVNKLRARQYSFVRVYIVKDAAPERAEASQVSGRVDKDSTRTDE